MVTFISQRQLSDDRGDIMRRLDRGETFIVTRDGVPVGELTPVKHAFVDRAALLDAFEGAPPIDAQQFRRDVDAILDQRPEPLV